MTKYTPSIVKKGKIPTTIKGLAIALDSYLAKQEEANKDRHDELMNMVAGIKITVNKDCETCRTGMNKNLENMDAEIKKVDGKVDKLTNKLKYAVFISENPKSAVLMAIGILAVLVMGFENIYEKVINFIK